MSKVISVTMNPSMDKTILLHKLVPYGLNRVRNTRIDPGGKGINVGRVLQSFGVDVTVTGLIAGRQGEVLLELLREAELNCDFLKIEGETRTNYKIIDESINQVTEINEQGFCVEPHDADSFLEKLDQMSGQAEIVILSGSLPPGIPIDFYGNCTEIAKKKGAKVLLDSDGATLTEGLKALPYAVKPNLRELGTVFHKEFNNYRQVGEAAKKLIDQGIEIVIASMGPDGAVYANRNEIYKADSWNIPVKSTVGAGDAMVATLAYSILKQDSLHEIARLTTAASTITVSKIGTQFCSFGEVLESAGKVNIRSLL
ncbi:MAG: 1-phosphofructokinase [Eubacteriales bacterium]|nr:1-phosphofructokinase [Eubacteriales bacterium]